MKCKIEVDMDGAAFDNNTAAELARVLRDMVEELLEYGVPSEPGSFRDTNGNRVGSLVIEE